MPTSTSFNLNQKGIAHIFVVLLLLIGVGAGIYLVQNPAIFKPRASEEGLPSGYTDWSFDPRINKKCFLTDGPGFSSRAYQPKDESDCPEPLLDSSGSPKQNINRWLIGFHAAHPNPSRGQAGQPDELPCPALYNLTQEGNPVKVNWNQEGDGSYEVQFLTDIGSPGKVHPCGSENYNWISLQDNNRATYPNPFELIADYDFWFDRFKIEPNSEVRVILAWQGSWTDINNQTKVRNVEINLLAEANDYAPGMGGHNGDNRVTYFSSNWTGSDPNTAVGVEALSLRGEANGLPFITLKQNNNYRVNWGNIINTFSSDSRYFAPPKDKRLAKTASMSVAIETANRSASNSIISDLRIRKFRIYGSGASSSPSPTSSPLLPSGQISASPNPCNITSGSPLCKSTINWSTSNTKDTVHVRVRESGAVFTRGTNGSAEAPWITNTPYHFDLYDGPTLLNSVEVKGVIATPTATITASPNPCNILPGKTHCTSTITWSSQNAPDLEIKVTGGASFTGGPNSNGSGVVDWIPASGVTFDAYSGGKIIKTLTVKGVPQKLLSASPNPCRLGSNGLCSTIIKLDASGYSKLQIFANGVPMTGEGVDPKGSYPTGNWIPSSGVTFTLKSNNQQIDSLTVKGVR